VKSQASTTLIRGGRALRLGAALLLVLLPSTSTLARVRHNDAWARQQFAIAERMREALNGRPAAQRTRHGYQRVIDSYRRVYFGSPASSKADPSVVATAELMVEMGRQFGDDKMLRDAVEQYRFLRKEYPGSKYRFDALFTIGEIFKDDLHDLEQARATFEDFINRYPRNRLVEDARAAVQEIQAEAETRERLARKSARKQTSARPSGRGKAGARVAANNSPASASAPEPTPIADGANERRDVLPRVTGVRHWSTPGYTRVAIDVEQEVKFGSQRISNPDRIFFDLRDTRLASTLVGKTFDVDDGFLKKIRVAESQPGRTRIVLEVDDLASYDAFLLPDPYRLIIDIRGKNAPGRAASVAAADASNSSADARSKAGSDTKIDAVSTEVVAVPAVRANKYSELANADRSAPPPGLVETDLPPVPVTAEAKPGEGGKPVNGIGVIRTTVAVKGASHRIPKTIVEAEDEAPSKEATIDHGKVKFKKSPAEPIDTSDLNHESRLSSRDTSRESTREARPMAAGDRSLIRALGLKIGKIVIDPGHGGHDTGTIGPNGLLEKDVALDVAKRLGRLLETRLGAEVIYTRKDDTFIPLETRTAIANRERADLFISIHANSSHDADARGVETYYLNFTSSPEALEVAARENSVSEKSIHELQDLVKKITLKDKIDESREFAGDVQQSLYGGLSLNNAGIRNRGIKKAPFIVLIGANMPSILAEVSFVSNPTDARKMETSEHRQRIADSLYRGVSRYVSGLSGVKVASRIDKPVGQ
jgi:N-acetylmuramoyl-L-alanine amidase